MSIPRSKSVPVLEIPSRTINDITDAGTLTPPVEKHQWRTPRRIRQRLALVTATSPLRSPMETPRSDREDPFNMGGFFPAHVSTLAEEDEEWSWLHQKEADDQDHPLHGREPLFSPVESEEESESVPATPKIVDLELEEQAKKVLQEEDKLGILHFADMFVAPAQSRPDEHLLSPYTGDQPENDDALYNGLRALRCAHSVPTDAQKPEDSKLGELFLPESADEQQVDRRGLVSLLSRWLLD
ncbi:hypothetical protein OE88DRAFT_1730472 [Heliocybe sulcata]|uniref:Uncharacterized protein n=1 Tax=Heliocybe sulcata TaxID=5364 RepID=A0A5C3NGM2_9AGAM|nr:hypothetical protein OE88DRAFT_1730472 [Heliocybe sulcata]